MADRLRLVDGESMSPREINMSKTRKLTALLAATVAVSLMTGTSAFAETRHRAETQQTTGRNEQARTNRTQQFNSNSNDRNAGRQGNSNSIDRNAGRQGNSNSIDRNAGRQGNSNSNDRNAGRQGNSNSIDRNAGRQGNSTYDNRSGRQNNSNSIYRNDRNNNSNYNNGNARGNNSNYSYRNDRGNSSTYQNETRRSESFQGRVSRVEQYRGGYNVWVGGARFPFFIGADRWSRFPIRVGLDIRLGGYWNPAGYYDVYDVGQYATAGNLHGVVESVDYRRGTLVMRDDVSGSFITVVMRGNDPRFGSLREGDQIDLTGAWNRSGVFDAYNVADVRGGDAYDPRSGDGRGGY
jgi:hypothetical protein